MKTLLSHINQAHRVSDTEVVERVLAGEKEFYEILMRRHNQKLYRIIRSYLHDEEEVEDAMQDTYLKAYKNLSQFSFKAQFSTWLIRIGINEALGRLRQQKKLAAFHDQKDNLSELTLLQLPDTKNMNPEHKAIQKEVKQLLEKAIDKLPAAYKTIYMLREVEEMSVTEVAACLNLSESNVKVRQHRARLLLKERLYEMSVNSEVFEFGSRRCDRMVEKVMGALPS
ncbi:RNA polymerase sigma factor [Pontibacter ruber]|uniref:RNA polymerase sigma factor n=1 Tax=Pontibacter ruber TaxID=1343895 RepID=A0ABW5CW70_9BACT|nr:RNA polymerase sigma factor [Pontibacter ruber]